MLPKDSDAQSSLDGMRPHRNPESKITPEYRYDHELPAPVPEKLLDKGAVNLDLTGSNGASPQHPRRNKLIVILIAIIGAILAMIVGGYVWYQQQLAPVTSDTSKRVRVTIESGATLSGIANELKSAKVIRSQAAFALYMKLTGVQDKLKAGVYSLQPSLSTPAIVDHLVSGKQDTFHITFLPGDTLANNRKKLIDVGYSATEVDAALIKTYNRPLFASKPAGTDLEGYIFGDTYEFDESATAESILGRTFDEYEAVLQENNLVAGFQKQGLSLYEGITLASIVQREVTNPTPGTASEDQRQVARVFLNRMKAGMTLGSDVTYQYAARKMGVDPTPTLASPYNTRIHTGLPPGPISAPGAGALIAVANPAANDYLFFLSGDDDVTYFAKTDAEHQQNIINHCQKKCLIN